VVAIARRSVRSAPLRGKKPSNTKRDVGRPLITSAIVSAEGPGTAVTTPPALITATTSRSPGSLIPGVPASVINATFEPVVTSETISSRASYSVCSLITTNFFAGHTKVGEQLARVSRVFATNNVCRFECVNRTLRNVPEISDGVATRTSAPRFVAPDGGSCSLVTSTALQACGRSQDPNFQKCRHQLRAHVLL